MRRLALAIPLLALLAIPLTSGTAAANKSVRAPLAPLQIAEHQLTGWRYSLESLTSCEVGDGLAVLKNVGDAPLVVTHVSAITSGSRKLMMSHWSYELLSVRTGSTTGELAASFTLRALGHGRSLGIATGNVIEPLSDGGSWYDIVALLRLPAGSMPAWEIRGISVSYELGAHRYMSLFRQSVHLPASYECA